METTVGGNYHETTTGGHEAAVTEESAGHAGHEVAGHSSSSELDMGGTCGLAKNCTAGLLLPVWSPNAADMGLWTQTYRAGIYLLALAYLLFGVNILTDRMVSAIEVIVAQKKTVRITSKSGEVSTVRVMIWHPVVATLTVFVIGASSAEIFLPVIEVAKHHWKADELGPSLIFGSGAYHLFFITSICLGSVKETIGKPIEDLKVFFVTAAFSLFAYVWIFLLVEFATPGVITLYEALLTLALFPLLVFTAWFVERRLYRTIWHKLLQISGAVSPYDAAVSGDDIIGVASGTMLENERRRRLAELLRELKIAHPEKTQLQLEEMAQMKMLDSVPKGAAFYRMQASKSLAGGGNVISKDKIKKRLEKDQKDLKESKLPKQIDPHAQLVGFEETNYTCMESCVLTVLTVHRSGAGVSDSFLLVDFQTVEDTAKEGEDYEPVKGTLEFPPGTLTADVVVKIVDDDEFEEDKDFKVELSNARLKKSSNEDISNILIINRLANVRILDDDHCGVFKFETADVAFPDNIGTAKIKVVRSTGARGRVELSFKVIDGSAKEGNDFVAPKEKSIVFENDQFEGFIEIQIVDENRVGEIYTFFAQLEEPKILTNPPQNPLGNPVLGDITRIKIGICEDNELSEALDRLLRLGDIADMISSTSWGEQFREAIALNDNSGEEGDENDDQGVSEIDNKQFANCFSCLHTGKSYVIYAISLPWRLLAAAVPPAGYLNGWLTFILLLVLMAIISALIGDLATAFGCTVGLKDTVTAVTLIALGMGLPDTFASRHAAMHEKTSDAAIGHITGSNAVNVFLGIGISWTAAAAYHAYKGDDFELPHSNMAFVVVIYCGLATIALATLLLRRLPPINGELGGPQIIKIISSLFFVSLWLTFIILLALENYCIIPGFSISSGNSSHTLASAHAEE